MPVLFVARSAKLARWSSDVGFGKHLYKIGVSDDDPKALAAAGWRVKPMKIVRRMPSRDCPKTRRSSGSAAAKGMIDPKYLSQSLKGALGVFRVAAEHVETTSCIARARRRQRPDRAEIEAGRLRRYLVHNALRYRDYAALGFTCRAMRRERRAYRHRRGRRPNHLDLADELGVFADRCFASDVPASSAISGKKRRATRRGCRVCRAASQR